MLEYGNCKEKRGINYAKRIKEKAIIIMDSLNIIRTNCHSKEHNEIDKFLSSQRLKVDKYIGSFITGESLDDNRPIIDDDFYECKHIFEKMQDIIKDREESISEKLT